MPSKLTFFKTRKKKVGKKTITIPKGDWKGKGFYYNRGKGSGGYTRYSKKLDAKRGRGVGSGNMRHTHDLKRTPKRKVKKAAKKTSKKSKKKKK